MTKEWRKPDGAVYVGRPGKFGNPFRIYKGHTSIGPMWHVAVNTWGHIPADECIYGYVTSSCPLGPESVVELYRMMLESRRQDDPDRLREWLAPLVGKDLMCWCPLYQPCHADVLLEIANGGGDRG
jgi:hypothetical protein